MPYIGRELDRGNYLKLDDISSTFDSSTTTFNLTNGGKAFYPGSAFSILVILAGVVQEPETAYQINQAQITFASAPLAGDQFFCIVLGQALGVNIPANGSVNGAQLAKPFNYDGYFYLDDANNRVGIATATPQKPLHVVGEGQFDSVRVLGDLTVDGTTTTLDTTVTEVDKLEVAANNNTVGVAITQSGTGDILRLYDGATQAVTVEDGGNVGLGIANPAYLLHLQRYGNTEIVLNNTRGSSLGGFGLYDDHLEVNALSNHPLLLKTNSVERLRITSNGFIGISNTSPELQSSAARNLVIGTPGSGGQNGLTICSNTSGTNNIYFGDASSGQGESMGRIVYSHADDSLRLHTVVEERLRITSTGNIGIGTDDPQSKFEVYGTSPIVRSKHSTSQKYTQINHDGTNGYLDWSSGDLLFRGASNDVRLRIDANGDITTSSSITTQTSNIFYENNRRVLEVHGGATQGWLAVGATRSDTDAYVGGINFLNRHGQADAHRFLGYIRLKSTHVNTGQYGTNVLKGQLEFATKSPAAGISTTTPDMVISPTGDMGLGTNSPNQKLHLHVAGTGGNKIKFTNDTTATGASDGFTVGIDGSENAELRLDEATNMLFVTNSTERLRIDSSGRLLKSGQASLTSTSLSHPIQIAADSDAQNIACFGRAADDISAIDFYEADKTTNLGEIQYRRDHVNFRHRVGYISFATGGVTERLRITSGGDIQVDNGNLHIDDNGEFAIFEQNTSLAMTNSSKISMDFASNVARIRSSHNGSGGNAVSRPLAFFIGSSEKLRIDSDGRLIAGGATASNAWTGGDDLILGNTNSGTRTGITLVSHSGSDGGIYWSDGTSANAYRGQLAYNHANDTMSLYTAAAARLRITSGGIVLINDANVSSNRADAPLQIETGANGNALNLRARAGDNIYSYLNFQNTAGSQTAAHIYLQRDASNNAGMLVFGTAAASANTPTERLRIDSQGRLGVGVTPKGFHANNKDVIQGSSGYVILGRGTSSLNICQNFYYDSSDAGKYIATGAATVYNQSNGSHTFYNASSGSADAGASLVERFQIQSDGRVSIGAPASNALGALHIHANQGTDTALWIGDSSTNRYLSINEQGSSQNFNHINTRYNDNGIHAHYIIDNPYANAAGYGSQILFRGYNNGTTAYIETSNEAASTARGTLRLRGADNHGLDVRSTGEVSTTHASNIGYETNAATNTRSLVYTSLDPQKRSTTAADWYILKTFHPNKSGRVNIHADMYITSGTYYFSFRVREEGTDTIVFNAGDNGGYTAYENPSGQAGNVHSYKTYKWICPLIKAHKRYYIEMAATNAAGTNVNSNANQQVFLKRLYIYSMSGGHSDGSESMMFQQSLDEPASTNYGGTTRAAMSGNVNRDSINTVQYFAGTESTFLGWYTTRAYNRYLDFELNISGSYMWFAQAYGYLYSRGQVAGSMISGYTYTNNQILNKFSTTVGSRGWYGSYRTSAGNLCLKFDSGGNGYSEGRIALFIGTHGPANPDWRVLRYRQNDTTNNIF